MDQEPNLESPEIKWENLSEVQKEVLADQCGITDAETLEIVLNPEGSELSRGLVSRSEVVELLRQTIKDFE